MVDYSSLENYRTERYRGFESLSLRKEFNELIVGLFFCVKSRFMNINKSATSCGRLRTRRDYQNAMGPWPMQEVVPRAVRAAVRIDTMT